jgi:hypothetical protein
MAIIMGKLELVWQLQQTLIKVHERVGWIAEMAVTEKLKKMWQSMTEEKVQQILREADERVIDTVLDQLGHGCWVRVFPPPGEDDNNALVLALNDGDSTLLKMMVTVPGNSTTRPLGWGSSPEDGHRLLLHAAASRRGLPLRPRRCGGPRRRGRRQRVPQKRAWTSVRSRAC